MKDEMRVENPELTPKQQQAIVLLARGESVVEAAKQAKVSEQTIYNWKADPDFMEDLKDETRTYLNESRARLGSLALPAIEVLSSLLQSENPNIQLKSANMILRANGLAILSQELHALQGLGLETDYSRECELEEEKTKKRQLLQSMANLF